MIKKMFVEVQIEEGKTVTLELNIVGDGISAAHSHYEDIDGKYSTMRPEIKLFWENEEGMKTQVGFQPCEKEAYIKMLADRRYFKQGDLHMWNVQPYRNTFYDEGSPGHRKYDQNSPFLLYGLGTVGAIIDQAAADILAESIIDELSGRNYIEEYELNELGHVYTLSNGEGLIIRGDASYYFVDGEDAEYAAGMDALKAEQEYEEHVDNQYGKVEEVEEEDVYDQNGNLLAADKVLEALSKADEEIEWHNGEPVIPEKKVDEMLRELKKPLNGEEI